jgi:selenoprotein W-related protein
VAAELKEAFGVEATLIPGSGGVFEVKRDGDLIYAKAETGRFPNPGEVSGVIEEGR